MQKLSIPALTERQANLMLAAMRVAIYTLEDKNDKQALRAVMINIKEAQYAAYLSKKTADEAKLIAQLEHTDFTHTKNRVEMTFKKPTREEWLEQHERLHAEAFAKYNAAPITKPNETTQNDN